MQLTGEEVVLFYFKDVSPIVQAREARDAAREKELILATSSHELRTPLNGILNMLQMIETDPEDRERYIKIARISSRLMLSLVNDMLDFSSIVSKKFVPRIKYFELGPCVYEAADMLRFLIEEKGLSLHVSVSAQLPISIHADRDRFTQVILNLLSNAYKYTLRGNIWIDVNPLCMPGAVGSFLHVTVRDTGIGILERDRAKLFRLFSRINDGARLDRNGIGLGLTICRNLVQQFNGDIGVESVHGQGSTFSFTFEYSEAPQEEFEGSPVRNASNRVFGSPGNA